MSSSRRLERVAALLEKETGEIITRHLDLPKDALVTVLDVALSPDLLHAAVRISVYPAKRASEVLESLAKNIWPMQQLLNQRLRMRPVPKIRFVVDRSQAEAEKIEKTLKRLEKE